MEMNNINPLKLSNVVLSSKAQQHFTSMKSEPRVHKTISKLIFDLAVEKPLWIFTATDVAVDGVHEFVITQEGEELGTISKTWYRGNNSIALTNERISAQRERSNSYRTADPTKALLTAKKMFVRKNSSELIKESKKKAFDVMRNIKWNKERSIRNDEATVCDAQLAFARGTGYAMFIEHTKGVHDTKTLKAVGNMETHRLDMMSIEAISSQFDDDKTALVVLTNGKYLVLVGDAASIYNDHELPDNIRGKLGLLKLVEKEHVVSGMGCRVSDEVFVVLIEKQDEVQSHTGV
jgi:hypothetical protein